MQSGELVDRQTESGSGRSWLGICLLGLLSMQVGSRWLVENAWPAAASSFASQAIACWIAAVWFAVWTFLGRVRGSSRAGGLGFWGWLPVSLVIAGAVFAGEISMRRIGADDATLALALTPVVGALASSGTEAENSDIIGILWPGLGGLAGLLLLLPEPANSGWRFWLALAAMPVLVGNGAAFALPEAPQRASGGCSWRWSLGCVVAGVVFGALAWRHGERLFSGAGAGVSLLASGLDAVSIVLTLAALSRLGVARWSAQFLLIPLVALVEGVVLLHPALEFRSWIGLTLLAFGAGRLLLAERIKAMDRLGLT